MTSDPEQIRRDIEGTQRELSTNVDALAEKVNPSKVVERRVERARGAVTSVKDKIMGNASSGVSTASDKISSVSSAAADTASSAASSAVETVEEAPRAIRQQAQGNPLAAGLIAFAAGWLVSSLIPSSRREQEVATQAKDLVREHAQPVAEQLGQAAAQVKDDLREPVQQAVETVKSTAGDAASTVTDETRAAAGSTAERAQEAKKSVRRQTQTRSAGSGF